MSKMMEGIKIALELIEDGQYIVDVEEGKMYNKQLKEVGSLDKPSGNIFYVIKGVDILAHRLLYAYYNGRTVDALKEGHVVKHLDGNKQNNTPDNLVQVPRKGAKKALEAIIAERAKGVVAPAPQAPQAEVVAETTNYTEKELEARNIMQELLNGLTIKEVAEKLNVKTSRVYDVKRGKSNAKATEDLRSQLV